MGTGLLNFNLLCDHATPDKNSAVELHMELPIPHADLGKLQRWFEAGEWAGVENYLIARHPEHSALISDWIAGSKQRSEGGSPKPARLAAVG